MAKSLTNFDVSVNFQKIPRLQRTKYFPFCGNLIDVETLDVLKDFTRMEDSRIGVFDSLTIERTQNPGNALIVKTLKFPLASTVLTLEP